jgi:hypothetical protein
MADRFYSASRWRKLRTLVLGKPPNGITPTCHFASIITGRAGASMKSSAMGLQCTQLQKPLAAPDEPISMTEKHARR